MKIGKPTPQKPGPMAKSRPPVRLGGAQTSKAQSILDDGETRGAAQLGLTPQGRLGKPEGSTGKGPSSKGAALKRPKVPKPQAQGGLGGLLGMLPGIAGPTPGASPQLAIGQRPRLGGRTLQAMKGRLK